MLTVSFQGLFSIRTKTPVYVILIPIFRERNVSDHRVEIKVLSWNHWSG